MGENGKSERAKIAVILASMHGGDYAYQTLTGIMKAAEENKLDIYIFNADVVTDETVKHTVGEYNIYELINFSAFDGVILFANLIQAHSVLTNIIEKIRKSGVPTVSIDMPLDDFYYVGVENYDAMKHIVSHLIEEHHYTKINYLSGLDFNTDSQERLAAYCDAMKEHGLPVEEKRIFKGAFTNVFGMQATEEMLASEEGLPEAIVCATDWVALGVRSVLVEHGIDIPGQVALTGFDNVFDAQNAVPRFTTVDRDMNNVGKTVIEELIRIINGEDVPRSQRFPAVPVIGESCGCVNGENDAGKNIRIKYLKYKEYSENCLHDIGAMIEELNDSVTFEEFLSRLKKSIIGIDCRAFYLCLDKEFVEDLHFAGRDDVQGVFHDNLRKKGISERMEVPLAYENGEFTSYGSYSSKEILPQTRAKVGNHHVYVFSPLHFQDNFMGYVAIDHCQFAMEEPLFNTWMLGLSISLETLRKQAHLKSMLQVMDRMYMSDQLTGLYNRFGFSRYTSDSFRRCIRLCGKVMILFADLDGLKTINDVYGHEKGDVAICAVADALKKACEGSEICARFGGDEYVVYAEGYSEDDAKEFGKRFEKILAEKNAALKQPFAIEASYGYITVKPRDGESIDKYIDMADNVMYFNKKTRKAKKKSQTLPQN